MSSLRRTLLAAALAALASCSHSPPPPDHHADEQPASAAGGRSFEQLAAVDVPGLNTQLSPDQVASGCEQAEKAADARLAALVSVPDDKRTFASSFGAFEQAMADYSDAVGRLAFLKDI